jgi:hypothetical protein
VTNAIDANNSPFFVYRVENPIRADAQPPHLFPRELLASMRPWFLGK